MTGGIQAQALQFCGEATAVGVRGGGRLAFAQNGNLLFTSAAAANFRASAGC